MIAFIIYTAIDIFTALSQLLPSLYPSPFQ